MKIESTVRLGENDIKQAVADYIGKAYGLTLALDQVRLCTVQTDQYRFSFTASVSADDFVSVTNGER